MKTQLTEDQLSEMYQSDSSDTLKNIKKETFKPKHTKEFVLMEQDGIKIQVPTYLAYHKLLEENRKLKSDFLDLQREVKVLKNMIKTVNNNVQIIDEELKQKVDIKLD